MPRFIIERKIPDAGKLDADELHTISQQSNGVIDELTQNGSHIQWLQSYVVDDALYCIYIASDADIVREHARSGGFPADKVMQISQVIDPVTGE